MSQSALWWSCCCDAVPLDCCTIWDCVEVCDHYQIEVTYNEQWQWPTGQTLTTTEATFTWTTGGTRTTLATPSGCPSGTPGGYAWPEITVQVSMTSRDYLSRSLSACYDWTGSNPPAWQTTAQVCAETNATQACIDLCASQVGCDDATYLVKPPDNEFWSLWRTRTYELTHTYTAEECGSDPFTIVCSTECGDCYRLEMQFGCEDNPIVSGTYDVDYVIQCDADLIDEPWSTTFANWSLVSDCACNGRSLWKQGRMLASFAERHFTEYSPLRGTCDGVGSSWSPGSCDSIDATEKQEKVKMTWSWSCCRPAQGTNCPSNCDYSYDETSYEASATIKGTWTVQVTCL